METLSHENQREIVSAVSHEIKMLRHSLEAYLTEANVIYRPKLFIDGDRWCALYGDNLQSGVAGFGLSPWEAMRSFELEFHKPLRG